MTTKSTKKKKEDKNKYKAMNLESILTAAAKNVLSPISDSTVMASDLVKP